MALLAMKKLLETPWGRTEAAWTSDRLPATPHSRLHCNLNGISNADARGVSQSHSLLH